MGYIPREHSKASWELKCKTENPESARHECSLRVQHDYSRALNKAENSYASYVDSVGRRFYEKAKQQDKGRKPGSRIVWDERLEAYVLA